MKIEILNRYTKAIIISGEYKSLKDAIQKTGADLTGADLTGADLTRANLTRADLTGANLTRANLTGADLTRADLTEANLTGANLTRADLTGANLTRANLTRANLTGANLTGANLTGANLTGANLTRANLTGADLTGANLTEADLTEADLTGANLTEADLTEADLTRANLTGANLTRAKGINPYLCTPLLILLDQPEGAKLRAYKLVNEKSEGPIKGGLKYEIGKQVEVLDANTDPTRQCQAGINVATLDWCMREWQEGYSIFVVEFFKEDIACIPTNTNGKFRLFRCTPIAEKNLVEIGLIKQ